ERAVQPGAGAAPVAAGLDLDRWRAAARRAGRAGHRRGAAGRRARHHPRGRGRSAGRGRRAWNGPAPGGEAGRPPRHARPRFPGRPPRRAGQPPGMIAPARRAALAALIAIERGSDLPTVLARTRGDLADERDRALAASIVTGTLRWRARLDAHAAR